LTSKISDKDKKDWEDFISGKEKLPDKDFKNKNKNFIKSKSIDLHGLSLEQANRVIEKFIHESFKKKVSKLIIVTGKGLHSENQKDPYVSNKLGILKYSVPEFINNNHSLMNLITDIRDAKIEDGGEGAFYIYLKKNKN
tara:strand:- start:89 stop:505 length:417 start_codon:yes stop_codon:yes gene_type:complete